MKIALATYGSRGDVQPFLALASVLRAEGHEPILCAPSDFEGLAAAHGLPFRRVAQDVRGALTRSEGTLRGMTAAMRYVLDQQLVDLPAAVEGCQLLLATGVLIAGPSLARALDIPYRYVVFCPRLLRSRYHAGPVSAWNEAPRWVNVATWWANDLIWNFVVRRFLRRSGRTLHWEGSVFDSIVGTRPLLAADPLLAPLPPDLVGRAVQTGAWFVPEDEPLPDDVEAFLAAGEPPVYLGFGSMIDPRPERTTRWIVEAVERVGVRALVSTGWAGLGAEALPPTVKVIGPVSHTRLFPRVRAVVHHGGAGTCHAAARAGVPQVLVPHLLDQFYWAYRLRVLGVSPAPLRRGRLSVPRLAAALRACVEDAGLGQRAREVAATLIQDGPRRALEALKAEGLL